MRRAGAVGAIAVTGTAATASTVSADSRFEDFCDASHWTQPVCAGHTAKDGINWLFGSSDDQDDERQEYLENEFLRIHGDMYRDALSSYGSMQTTTTWVRDNAELLEGRAYIRALLRAYDEIQQESATRAEAIDAGADAVGEIYATSEAQVHNEYALHVRDIWSKLQQLQHVIDEGGGSWSEAISADVYGYVLDIASVEENDGLRHQLVDGSELDVFSIDIETTGDNNYLTAAGYDGNDSVIIGGEGDRDGIETPTLEVHPFDDAEYRNVYDSTFDRVDGDAVYIENEIFETIDIIRDTHDDVVTNVEAFIDEEYEAMVDDEISRSRLETLESRVESISDDEPLAWVNAHLGLLGKGPAAEYTTVEFGLLTETDYLDNEEEYPYDPEDDPFNGREYAGTLYADPQPDEPVEVGETYTAEDFGGDVTTHFSMTFEDDGDVGRFEFEPDREFTVTEAHRLDEDGDLVETDEITFTTGMPTETPTDYGDLHDRLDSAEEFQLEILEAQYELIEEMAEGDDPIIDIGGIPGVGAVRDAISSAITTIIAVVVLLFGMAIALAGVRNAGGD
ncbi:hypothetical protein [Halovivax gelatinilyticus]|uniref:hypothetical protein n=1 Tax=Halovivax gelatinilyticus TaxID=2961597 RepID=UPI0020CA67CB|nr:hypothetical protein [Halovivax gelatinilyticus]